MLIMALDLTNRARDKIISMLKVGKVMKEVMIIAKVARSTVDSIHKMFEHSNLRCKVGQARKKK